MAAATRASDRGVIEHTDAEPRDRRVANITLPRGGYVIACFPRRQHPVMTLAATAGGTTEAPADMTGLTGDVRMGAGKWKSCREVIELSLRSRLRQARPAE